MNKVLLFSFFIVSMLFTPTNSHAFKEDFNFLILEVPFDWIVKNKTETEFTLETKDKTASFTYKIMPVFDVTIERFADAIMRAYGGYNLKLRASGVYYFDFISAGKQAWTIVQFCGENACIQTGVGNNKDLSALIDAGQLK